MLELNELFSEYGICKNCLLVYSFEVKNKFLAGLWMFFCSLDPDPGCNLVLETFAVISVIPF